MDDQVEIIPPEEAAAILEPKLQDLQAEGWIILVQHNYMARLTRGNRNLDLEVDLLGQLHISEKPLSPEQEIGQTAAWVMVVAVLLVVMVIASILGLLD